jgi:hypothetical protein
MGWEDVKCWNTVFVKSGLLGENSLYLPHVWLFLLSCVYVTIMFVAQTYSIEW